MALDTSHFSKVHVHRSFLLVLLSILLLFVFKFAVACFLQTYTGWLDIGVEQLLFIGKLCQIIACQSYTECMSLGKMKTAHGHEEPLESLTSFKIFCLEYKEKGR